MNLPLNINDAVSDFHLLLPLFSQIIKADFGCLPFFGKRPEPFPMFTADQLFPFKDLRLPVDPADMPSGCFNGRRACVQTYGHPGASRVQNTHGLVRELSSCKITMGQANRVKQGIICYHDIVVFLKKRGDRPHHHQGLFFFRFFDFDHLKPSGQGSVLFKVLLVFGPGSRCDSAQFTPGQRGFEQVGRVPRARGAARAYEGVGFIDEKNNGNGRGLDLLDHGFKPVFEFSLYPCSGLQKTQIESVDRHVF